MANANCDLCNTFHPYTKHAPITAGDLTTHHLGAWLTITEQVGNGHASVYQGQLSGAEHGASLIMEKALGSPDQSFVLGQPWVQVRLLNYGGARVSPRATVELLG